MKNIPEWVDGFASNSILAGDGWQVSWNPAPPLKPDTKKGETAIVIDTPNADTPRQYLILNGDFRKQYERAFPKGLEACIEVYESYKSRYRSSWSMDE